MNIAKSFIRLRKTIIVGFLAIPMAIGLQQCGNIYSPAEDAALGKEVNDEIAKDTKTYPILRNAAMTNYVQSIVNSLLRSPKIEFRGQFAYEAKIIHDDKTVNAFATPGGYIYVYTGLMRMLDNEATLAGILGHEIAHAERRHTTQRLTKAYGYQLLASIALGKDPNQAAVIVANLFTGLGLMHHSRSDELESDNYSFEYLRTSKWYPGGIRYFFQKTAGRPTSGLEELFATHPPSEDRLKNIDELLKKANIPPPTEKNLFAKRYKDMLKKLPPKRN